MRSKESASLVLHTYCNADIELAPRRFPQISSLCNSSLRTSGGRVRNAFRFQQQCNLSAMVQISPKSRVKQVITAESTHSNSLIRSEPYSRVSYASEKWPHPIQISRTAPNVIYMKRRPEKRHSEPSRPPFFTIFFLGHSIPRSLSGASISGLGTTQYQVSAPVFLPAAVSCAKCVSASSRPRAASRLRCSNTGGVARSSA